MTRKLLFILTALLTTMTAWADEITIASAENWMKFCNDVASGNTYSDKIVKMTANITTSTWMSGTFSGVFDGQERTVTIAIEKVDALGAAKYSDVLDACTAQVYEEAAKRWNDLEEKLWIKHGRGF